MADGVIPQDSKYENFPYFCQVVFAQILSDEASVPQRIVDKWDDIITLVKNRNKLISNMIVFIGNFHFAEYGSAPNAGNWLLFGIVNPVNNAGTIFCTHYANLQGCYMIKKSGSDITISRIDNVN